jgi:hypothetical protein
MIRGAAPIGCEAVSGGQKFFVGSEFALAFQREQWQ